MKAQETVSNEQVNRESTNRNRLHSYQKVFDGRKQPIRGLWKRNEKYVARLTVDDENGKKAIRWKVLEGADTVPQAQKALSMLQSQRDSNNLPVLKRTPKLADYAKTYFDYCAQVKIKKRPATIAKERGALNRWIEHMGETRVDRISMVQIKAFIGQRREAGISGRTVNLDVIALRNVLKEAIQDKHLKDLPMENLRPLQWTPHKRGLVTAANIAKVCDAAFKPFYTQNRLARQGETGKPLKNARLFVDYIWLMAYTGARMSEALRLRWADVNFERGQITIGSDGLSKNGESRVVDFYSKLETHLQEMLARRAPDSEFLFPSPQRGDTDASTKTFTATLRMARTAAGMASFGFHDCRHFFISYCVMSGIDFMTIARWAGHKDGGILIGKVYGHLSNEHAKQQAQRINFEPQLLNAAVA